MVINSRSGSHRVLLRRQLGVDPGEAGANPGEDEEGRNGEEEEDVEEEEVEDLFGQIVSGATGGGGVGGGGRDDWGDDATLALLQAWGDKCGALNKWQLRLEDWGEVAAAVRRRSLCPKTDVQCKNRVDTLKKKFKVERQRQCAMGLPSKWNFYQILDRLLAMAAANAAASAAARSPSLPVGADAGSIILRSENGSGKRQRIQEEDEEEAEEQGGGGGGGDEVDDDDVSDEEHEEHEEKGGGGEDTNETDQDSGGDEEFRRRGNKRKRRYSSSSPLADAIAKLGEIFERMEECKRQQLLDLEKIRMQFAKDLELHRMQLLLQTQRELAKLHHGIQ